MGFGERRYTDDQLKAAVGSCRRMSDVLRTLGVVPRGGNYETAWRRIRALGLEATHLTPSFLRGKPLGSCTDEEVASAVRDSRSLTQALAALGFRPSRSNERLKQRIAEMGLDTSHFVGQAWSRGRRLPPRRPVAEVLVTGRLLPTGNLKRRLIEQGLKEARCEVCGQDSWNGQPIPLELDHVNGVRDDNRLSNLRILCPNCHAQNAHISGSEHRNIGALS